MPFFHHLGLNHFLHKHKKAVLTKPDKGAICYGRVPLNPDGTPKTVFTPFKNPVATIMPVKDGVKRKTPQQVFGNNNAPQTIQQLPHLPRTRPCPTCNGTGKQTLRYIK